MIAAAFDRIFGAFCRRNSEAECRVWTHPLALVPFLLLYKRVFLFEDRLAALFPDVLARDYELLRRGFCGNSFALGWLRFGSCFFCNLGRFSFGRL